MNNIYNYLIATGKSPHLAEVLTKRFKDCPDITFEYEHWIETKTFITDKPVTEQGYTAKKLYDEWCVQKQVLNINGVFSLLVSLREKPTVTLELIKDGLPRK